MKVILKRVGKPLEVIDIEKEFVTDIARELIGDKDNKTHIETVKCGECFRMYCDEEGIPKGLPKNFGMWTTNSFYPYQNIFGDVVFIRHKYVNIYEEEIWDYEPLDVTEEDIETAKRVISGEV